VLGEWVEEGNGMLTHDDRHEASQTASRSASVRVISGSRSASHGAGEVLYRVAVPGLALQRILDWWHQRQLQITYLELLTVVISDSIVYNKSTPNPLPSR